KRGLFHVWASQIERRGGVASLHEELYEVHGVGRKIASFICRDTVYLADLEARVPRGDRCLLQPVDTWIRRIAEFLSVRFADGRKDEEVISKYLAELCTRAGV